MQQISRLLVVLTLTASLSVSGHVFNHEDRHDVCQAFTSPHGHGVDDGHAHTHDHEDAAALNLHHHDPCKQIGMQYPMFDDTPALAEISVPEAVLGSGPGTPAVSGFDEAFRLDVDGLVEQTDLVVSGDAGLAGMGFPGNGTTDDPYIIEGYLIRNVLLIRDTDACVVVRNNVIESYAVTGPLGDPTDIVELAPLADVLWPLYENATAIRDAWLDQSVAWDALLDQWNADATTWQAEADQYESDAQAWHDAYDAYQTVYGDFVAEVEQLADDFTGWSASYQNDPAPAKDHQDHLSDQELLEPSFEQYLGALSAYVVGHPPPEQPPEGWSASTWAAYRANYQTFVDEVERAGGSYEQDILSQKPDQEAYDEFQAQRAAFLEQHAQFLVQYNQFLDDFAAFEGDKDAAFAATQPDVDAWQDYVDKVEHFSHEYVGDEASFLFNDIRELVDFLLDLARDTLDEAQTAKLILDWNGQCVHAYHNVIEDLRVNRNVARTGYATGGIIEDNRIHDIGQIRHFDGILRDNEIGDRDHLRALLDDSIVAPPTEQSVNNDGFNQGQITRNIIYGRIDLDFHGHHHGAGFFAPSSHYHGSDQSIAYMGANAESGCKYYQDEYDYDQHREPQEYIGLPPLMDDGRRCLPHHNHGMRWTSVGFVDNIVIDPQGDGIRFEDKNHRGDDEQANSEDMLELKAPHFHRTHVAIRDNTVIGSVFIDRINADGTDLWSDDWSEVKQDDLGRILEAVQHLGAEVINSHPIRNDAWLDIEDNTVLVHGPGAGIRLVDAKELNLTQIHDNIVVGLPTDSKPTLDHAGALAWLASNSSADELWTTILAWGGTDSDGQTGIQLVDLSDSIVSVCSNAMRGIEKGLDATMLVYEDVSVDTCPGNDWGAADPQVSLAFIPLPQDQPSATDEVRPLTDDTYVAGVATAAFDVLEARGL